MQNEKDKKKKIDEINIETSYIDEQTVQTGTIESQKLTGKPVTFNLGVNDEIYKFSTIYGTGKPDFNWDKNI